MTNLSRTFIAAVVLAMAVAGCKPTAPASDAPGPTDAPTAAANVATPTATVEATASATVHEPTASVLAVDGEGVRLVDPASGAARAVPFGTPDADTEAVLTTMLGRAPDERGETSECGSRRFVRWNGAISAWFGDAGFSGWSLPDGSTLATNSGLRLGSARSDLTGAYSADVMASSLGTEFVAGTMGGVLDSDAPDAVVTHLWAGDTCIAR